MHKSGWIYAVASSACLLACDDPGCLRHTECESGYECRDSMCVALDAGVSATASSCSDAGCDADAGPSTANSAVFADAEDGGGGGPHAQPDQDAGD